MTTEKTYPKAFDGRQTTKEEWDRYELDLRNHENFCNQRQEFACLVIKMCKDYGFEKAYERICNSISIMRSMDAPDKPGYYRANND